MNSLLPRLRKVRERVVQREMTMVEACLRSHEHATEALRRRDQLLQALDAQAERLSAWLSAEEVRPAPYMSALARISALEIDREAAVRFRIAEATAVSETDRRLQQARRALAQARARLSGLETLEQAAVSAANRRRERLAELEQEDRRPIMTMEG